MKRSCAIVALAVFALVFSGNTLAQKKSGGERNMEIYWIDADGGAATLVIAPSGESMLIDTGYPDADRDAGRIHAAEIGRAHV